MHHQADSALRAAFDPADWTRIGALPLTVGMAVTAADPGGLWGAIRETAAMAGAVRTGAVGTGAAAGNPLVAAVVAGFASSEDRGAVTEIFKTEVRGRQPAEIVEALLAEVARLAALIDAKAPDAAPGFKAWLMQIADAVAEAGTEGGFLGFGGVKVSPQEAATLGRLRAALGLPAAV